MNIEKMMYIAKEDLRDILNDNKAHFMDRHVAMQTYMLAYICEKFEEKEQKSNEVTKDRHLIIVLARCDGTRELWEARIQAFRYAFAQKFPDDPKLTPHMPPPYDEWRGWIVGIEQKHVEWAKAAKQCGLIDSYIVDYDPEQEVEA
jgi:hypothetical protein